MKKKFTLLLTAILLAVTCLLTGCNPLSGVKVVDQTTMEQRFADAGLSLADENAINYAGTISWRNETSAYSWNLYDKASTALITYNDLTGNLANCANQYTATKGNAKCWKADNGEMAYAIYRVENMVVYGQAPISMKDQMNSIVEKLVKG